MRRDARNLISAQVGADDILRAAAAARDVPGRAVGGKAAPGPDGIDARGKAGASEACSAAPEARGVILLRCSFRARDACRVIGVVYTNTTYADASRLFHITARPLTILI